MFGKGNRRGDSVTVNSSRQSFGSAADLKERCLFRGVAGQQKDLFSTREMMMSIDWILSFIKQLTAFMSFH